MSPRSPRLGSSPNAVNIAFTFALFFNQLRMAGELQSMEVRAKVEWVRTNHDQENEDENNYCKQGRKESRRKRGAYHPGGQCSIDVEGHWRRHRIHDVSVPDGPSTRHWY